MSQATHTNITRRSILAGLAATLPAAAAAPALATSSQTDGRLSELGRQRLALKERLDAPEGTWTYEELDGDYDRLWAVEDEIVTTRAHSFAGLIVKLDAAQDEIERQISGSGAAETAFADLCETIRSLARIGSVQA